MIACFGPAGHGALWPKDILAERGIRSLSRLRAPPPAAPVELILQLSLEGIKEASPVVSYPAAREAIS